MTHVSRKRRQLLLFAVDLIILYSLIPLTLLVRNMEMPTLPYVLAHAVGFTAVIAIWELLSYGVGLYSLDKPFTSSQAFIKMMIVASVSMLSGFALFYLFLSRVITPKTVLLLYSLFSFCLLMLWRVLYDYFFGIRKQKPKVAFVGFNETVASLIREMKHSSYFGFTPLVVYDPDPSAGHEVTATDVAIPFLSDQDEFVRFIEESAVDIVILAREKSFPLAVRQSLFSLLENEVGFYNLPDFFEVVTRKIPIGSINDNWLLSHLDARGRTFFSIFKRGFDLSFSFLMFMVTAPLWPLIALGIKLESPGPVFFRQVREGRNGRAFTILKFRTMRVADNDFTPTGTADARITPIGNLLRKSRLDEIPQVLNVFTGDMSLIGPRPERPELAVELEKAIPYYRQRLIVKPGITGWDQVSGEYHSPSVEDTYKKLQFDLYYIKNRSLFLDLSIAVKTIATVLRRSGR